MKESPAKDVSRIYVWGGSQKSFFACFDIFDESIMYLFLVDDLSVIFSSFRGGGGQIRH